MAPKARITRKNGFAELIHHLRGQKVMLDFDLAVLYGVETRALNQAVKRNLERFPKDFMFRLSSEEMNLLAGTNVSITGRRNSSQIVMSSEVANSASASKSHRGRAYRYYAFTEQGVAMLSSVLRSRRAVQVNIEIMRAFIRLRQWLASNAELSQRLDKLENKFDEQFKVVFAAIRELIDDKNADQPAHEIGFHTLRAQSKSQINARNRNLKTQKGGVA